MNRVSRLEYFLIIILGTASVLLIAYNILLFTDNVTTVRVMDEEHALQSASYLIRKDMLLYSDGFISETERFQFYVSRKGEEIDQTNISFINYNIDSEGLVRQQDRIITHIIPYIREMAIEDMGDYIIFNLISDTEDLEMIIKKNNISGTEI